MASINKNPMKDERAAINPSHKQMIEFLTQIKKLCIDCLSPETVHHSRYIHRCPCRRCGTRIAIWTIYRLWHWIVIRLGWILWSPPHHCRPHRKCLWHAGPADSAAIRQWTWILRCSARPNCPNPICGNACPDDGSHQRRLCRWKEKRETKTKRILVMLL